jgi:HAMP domain-containing protein
MNAWKRLSLTTQYAWLLILIVVLMAALSLTLARDVNVSAKLNEARTVTDMVENIGTWASQYKGMWVRKESTDTKTQVGDFLNQESGPVLPVSPDMMIAPIDSNAITFHQKNPALIQREISQVTEKSDAKAKFRMTSDKFMNPDNAPNRFELTALENIRALPESKEYFEVSKNELLYARRIIANAACLRCHDTPEKAPKAVRDKYPSLRGYGYIEGEVIGVMSVKIPLDNVTKTVFDNLSPTTWAVVGTFFSALLLIFYMIRKMIITPLRRLQEYADEVRDADHHTVVNSPQFVENEYSSKNEIHKLSQALKALENAIKILVSK